MFLKLNKKFELSCDCGTVIQKEYKMYDGFIIEYTWNLNRLNFGGFYVAGSDEVFYFKDLEEIPAFIRKPLGLGLLKINWLKT